MVLPKKALFGKENGEAFNSLEKAFMWYSLFKFILEIVTTFHSTELHNSDTPYSLGYAIGQIITLRLPLLIFGLFLLIISRLMMNGYELKKENDLTI